MFHHALALALLVAATAPAATAQKIPSAEAGVASLSFAAFAAPAETVTVKPGDAAWTEQILPAYAVRLIDEAKNRPRPGTDGVPAGTLLFGYQLSTGMAFCPPLDPAKPFKRVQCFRDLDNDGKFDAGYVSGDQDADSRYFSSFLRAIMAVPKYRYERVSGDLLPPATGRIVFVDIKDGAPRFQLHVDKAKMVNITTCRIAEPGVCDAFGVRLKFSPGDGGALSLTFVGAATNRSLDVMNEFDPLKP